MNVKTFVLALGLTIASLAAQPAEAVVYMHYFDCKFCHQSGLTYTQIADNSVCLQCHKNADIDTPLNVDPNTEGLDGVTQGRFSTGDASNAMGHNPALKNKQTSHNWGAPDNQPAAGAAPPDAALYPGFYTRYGGSAGKVTCSRCHNPHGFNDNPKLLVKSTTVATSAPLSPETMCRACHKLYADQGPGTHGRYGHPVNTTSGGDTYTSAITGQETKYKSAAEVDAAAAAAAAAGDSSAQLVGGKITCLSCHGTHFADSDSTTADGVANRANLLQGDGLMLKGDGLQFVNDPARSTTFCNTCHKYEAALHGSGAGSVGCMGCHGGHNNTGTTTNYYMLNGSYPAIPADAQERAEVWGGTLDNQADGFCESCHGDIEDNFPTLGVPAYTHSAGMSQCTDCHLTHSSGAFSQPIGCDGCHGSPPAASLPGNVAAGAGHVANGYAWVSAAYNYEDTSTHYKDETLTPHTSHAGTTSQYKYDCKVCHNTHYNNFAATHNKDNTSFRDVLEANDYPAAGAINPYDVKASGNGAMTPAYADAAGTCSNVYCHSNGGINNGTGTRASYKPTTPGWAGTKGTITCASCHGNDATSMAAAQRGNSAAHIKHLNAGFSCNVCHVNTATGAATLKAGAIGTTHINVAVDVAFDTASNLKSGGAPMSNGTNPWNGASDTTCDAVYCHSTGQSVPASRTYRSIQWTSNTALTCTSCHDIAGAGQTAAHAVHVNGATSDVGSNLDCGVCHDLTMDVGSNGALGTGGLAYHVNGQVDVKMNFAGVDLGLCSNISCHSDGNFEAGATTTYKNAVWTSTTGLGCASCHGNGTVSYPSYANGGTGVNSNSHQKHVGGGIVCGECHSQTSTVGTALDGSDKTKHVNRTVEVSGSKITSYVGETCSAAACHGAGSPVWGGTVACGSCHAANNTLAQSHPKHYEVATAGDYTLATNSSVSGSYVIQCGVCHSTNGAGAISHAGGWVSTVAPRRTAQVNFDGTIASGTYTAGGTETADGGFYYTNATCASLYCHGNFGGNGNAATATWGNAASGACGTCHDVSGAGMSGGSHAKHVFNAGVTCDYCHGATAVSQAGGIVNKAKHVNRALEWDFAAASKPQTAGATYNGTGTGTIAAANVGNTANYAQCANLYCHSNVQAVPPNGTVGVTYSTPTWGGAAACGSCHKGDAAGVEQDTASHLIHTDADQYGSRFACSACHDGAGSGTTKHADYAVDVNINASYDRGGVGAGTYSGTAAPGNAYGSCTSLTCHSNGQGGSPLVTPTWNVALSCAGCHDEAKSGTTLSGAHAAHTFGGATTIGRNLGCQECHADTVSNNTTVTSYVKHVNFTKDLKVPNFGTPQAGCATVYCHSNGNYNGTAGVTFVYNNPAWSANYSCASCHGNGTVSYPTYANGGTGVNANSHEAHIVGGGYACGECHSETSTGTGVPLTINGTAPTKHVDHNIDVKGTKISSYAGGTCSTVSCHGGNNATWGATLGCRDCHGNATTDTDDFTYNNSTFAKVALDEWSYSGHGKLASANYEVTGRAGADLDTKAGAGQDACLYCHDGTVSHGAANLFRLRSNGFMYNAAADLNGTCRACHETGTTSFDPDGAGGLNSINVTAVVKIDKFHGGTDHDTDTKDAGRWCWDCHDPHGDADATGQRIQMVQRNPQVNPNDNGVPASLSSTDVIFYNRTAGVGPGAFAMNTLNGSETYAQGICNNCHTNTDQYQQGDGTGIQGAGTHPTSTCTTCHKHSGDTTYNGDAFKGSGCNGCHGDATAGNYWPDNDATVAMPTANNDPNGRHAKHMTVLSAKVYDESLATLLTNTGKGTADAKQRALCEYCHAAAATDKDHAVAANVPAEVFSTTMPDNSTVRFAKHLNGAADGDAAYNVGADTCSNVDCHNSKLTTDNTYGWYDAGTSSAITCDLCHTKGTAGANPASGLHAITNGVPHDNTLGASGCAICHTAPAYSTTSTHINGTFNADSATANDRFVVNNIQFTWTDGTISTCTASCHSDRGNWARQWSTAADNTSGVVGSPRCNVCHGQPSGLGSGDGWRTGLTFAGHNLTKSATDKHTDCAYCHYASADYLADAKHRNVTGVAPNQRFAVTYNSNAGYDVSVAGSEGCTNACHATKKVMGRSNMTVFNDEGFAGLAVSCNSCHKDIGGATTASTMFGYTFQADANGNTSHTRHVATAATSYVTAAANTSGTTSTDPYDFTCASCHGNIPTNHMNGALNIALSAPGWDSGTKQCSNNACHQDGLGGNAIKTADWNLAGGWVGGDADGDRCNNCHGNSPTSNAHRAHAVGIHAEDIYSGATGKLTTATAAKSHGDVTTSTTISCNICHSATVTMARNKFGTECSSCHSVNPSDTTNVMAVADKSKHVDGTKDVAFADMTAFKSKAQLRDNLADAVDTTPEPDSTLAAIWNRLTGYKAAATDHDEVKAAFAVPVFAAGNCSNVACHNNNVAIWNERGNIDPATYAPNCMACHTSLPK